MTRRKTVFIIGLIIFLLPVLGFPVLWETIFQLAVGLALMFMAARSSINRRLSISNKRGRRNKGRGSTPVFVESNPPEKDQQSVTVTQPSEPILSEDQASSHEENRNI